MATFWVGAGAAATVILAAIGILQFVRSRSNLRVVVTKYPFELPVTAQRAVSELSELLEPWDIEKPPVRVAEEIQRRIQTLDKLFGVRSMRDVTTCWRLTLTNHGHERADGIELYVPGGVQIAVERAGARDVFEKDRAAVGDVRPGETVNVVAWARHEFAETPSVILSKGRAVVRMRESVDARWVTLWDVLRPLVAILLVAAVIVGIEQLWSRLNRSPNATPSPRDSTTVVRPR